MQDIHDTTKHVIDAASIGVWAAAMVEILPAVAALISIIWGVIRIYETRTVQKLLGKKPQHLMFQDHESPPEEETDGR